MKLQVLASGSRGNASLLRAGDLTVLIDSGLGPESMRQRLRAAGVGLYGIDHILVSHGHLDHSRSAGKTARSFKAVLHAPATIHRHRSCLRAERLSTLPVGGSLELAQPNGSALHVTTVRVPHDCDPTVGFRIEYEGRILVHVTDLGHFNDAHVRSFADPHVLVVESNHDADMLSNGPYPEDLTRRVSGPRGHLSNEEGARFAARLAGPRLHTVVLAHLSTKNNRPDLAEAAMREALARSGHGEVSVLCASQAVPTETIDV